MPTNTCCVCMYVCMDGWMDGWMDVSPMKKYAIIFENIFL